ncbi:hypothetical protein [Novosphingobium sp.]|uniref:hypothetical protein n=1 Tax=Novosphingobium sp. TaxID=1874826 RepID=UPI0025E857D6|nr:hypothetical protein [Novosphingobium sp.]MCC6926265.1 hypothetical protein [Novosphingobium sp.]
MSDKVEDLVQSNRISEAESNIKIFLDGDLRWILMHIEYYVHSARYIPDAFMPFPHDTYSPSSPFSMIRIFDGENLSIQVSSVSPIDFVSRMAGKTVQFSGQKEFYRLLSGRPMTFRQWQCDRICEESDFMGSACRFAEPAELVLGETLEIDGACQAISIDKITSPCVYVQISIPSLSASVSVDFDAESLAYRELHPRNGKAARSMFLLSTLRNIGTPDRAEVIKKLALTGPFYQRWYAVRELLAIDPAAGAEIAKKMVDDDVNPSVRRAARATLDFLASKAKEEA